MPIIKKTTTTKSTKPIRRRKLKIIRKKRRLFPRMPYTMRPKVFKFKRDIEQVLQLAGTAPEGWSTVDNRYYKQLGWSLGSLGDITDFQNLFKQYRILGARIRLYFSNTVSGEDGNAHSNSQILVRMAPNQGGTVTTLNNSYWQSIQAKRYKLALNGGKPLDIYMPLAIENRVQSSSGTQTTMMKPQFLDTVASNVVHYGLNLSLERADGQAFTSGHTNHQFCRMVTTLYFQTRAVI